MLNDIFLKKNITKRTMSTEVKAEFNKQLSLTNDTKNRIDYAISLLRERGRDNDIITCLEPVSNTNLIVLNQTHVNIFAKCMENMNNNMNKLQDEVLNLKGRIGGIIDASIQDVLEQNEDNHNKSMSTLKEIPELISVLMDEVSSLKSKVNPLADRNIEEIAETMWSKYGQNYKGKKVTKALLYNIVEDIKKII